MAAAPDLAKMVPGFEFLQGLMKNAGAALPGMGQWIAPTLDPKELDKRIQELKTVQFWLEQNARLLATTIQALEVQRMTLSTLQTMNLPMTDLRDALKIAVPQAASRSAAAPAQPLREKARKGAADAAAATAEDPPADNDSGAPAAPSSPVPAVDPLQWWGALTQQFTELASKAMQDGAALTAAGVPAPAKTASSRMASARAPSTAARKRRG